MSGRRTDVDALERCCEQILLAHGVDAVQAQSVSDNVIWSELVGRRNFGLARLPVYLERVRAGGLNCPCEPVFEAVAPSLHRLDGDGGFGQHVGRVAMDRAVDLASDHGIGVVGVHNSNFFGTGAYFVHQACEAGMIGLAMSNSYPKVAAHGGVRAVFGTNPLAFGAPRRGGESLLVDMATSALAGSTVRQHAAEGTPLPPGVAVAPDGAPITDAAGVQDGALTPFGGAKGYGLALLVEVLAGVLTGAGVSHGVASMYEDLGRGGNNGHLMLALDVQRWMPMDAYHDRFDGLVAAIKASGGGAEVLLPGEIRWRHHRDGLADGIALDDALRATLEGLAAPLGVAVPWREARVTGSA
jgi:LDH2 family malate/lactate/ureidoglycolate dehydrogenase